MKSLANTIELQKRRMGIYEVEVEEEKEETTLELMIKDLIETTDRYHKENKIFYEKVDKQLEEIQSLTKYTLSEQEKQRLESMNINELLAEMQKSLDVLNKEIDTLIERWG